MQLTYIALALTMLAPRAKAPAVPVCPPPTIVVSSAPQAQGPSPTEQANLAIQHRLELLTGGLVLVGALQGCVMGFQWRSMQQTLKEVHDQAGHMEKQTGILEKSLAMTVSAERAWLTTEARFSSQMPDISNRGGPEKSRAYITLTNSGKSLAEVISMTILTFLHPSSYMPSDEPDYTHGRPISDMAGETIAAGVNRMVSCSIIDCELLGNEQIGALRAGAIKLYCYGKVEYRDNSGERRLTQFGYRYHMRTNETDDKPEGFCRVFGAKYNFTE